MKPIIESQPYKTTSYVIRDEKGIYIGRIEVQGDIGIDDLLKLIRNALN